MMHRILRSLVFCAAAVLGSPGLFAQSLQLADGKVLLASVEDANGDGLRVRRLDNGGVLDLRWEHLSPASALLIKRQHDLVGDSQDELLERAEEVERLAAGGTKQTWIGKIVERTDRDVVLQTKGVQVRIPKNELLQVRQVDVPAAQIYTKDEFYAAKLAQFQPGDKADKHVLLADELIKFRDYDRALEHLQKAKELGNSLDPARIDRNLQRLQLYKDAAKEKDLLDQVQAARSRNTLIDFEKGTKLVAQFEKEFPQTRLKAEFELEKKRFQEARTRFLAQQVADQFRRAIQFVADKKVGDEATTLQAARDYAENKMSDDLFARIAQQFKLEVPEVKKLWGDRAKYPVGKRSEHFAYNLGSWILGEQGVLKGTEVGKQKSQQDSQKEDPNDRDVQKVARALKQAYDRRRSASQGQAGEDKEQTDEEWWQSATRIDRVGWLRAYYAEFGGQLVITYASVQPCISCYGEGTTAEMGGDGKMTKLKCYLCHATKWLRSFKAY